MKRLLLGTLVALVLSPAAWTAVAGADQTLGREQISDFHYYGHLDGWRPVDDHTLILWTTPFRPYLIELSRRSPDLRFAEVIGVTSTVGRVDAKLDSVLIRGSDYPIKAIYKLSREESKNMRQIQTVHRSA